MMTELEPRDRELAAALRDTLDKAASRHDPLLDAALTATRAQIAARSAQRNRHPWWLAGGFAVAAVLAVVLVLPFARTPDAAPVQTASMTSAAAMPDEDLQLLEDMDMLAVMSEAPHEG